MADLVVDSSVWVASFLPNDQHYQQASQFITEFRAGSHHCYLPYLVLVETCAAVARRVRAGQRGLVPWVQQTFQEWSTQGLISWYDLDEPRANAAVGFNLSLSRPLLGADSVIASLANELGYPLLTYDGELLERFPRAVTP